MMAPRFLPVVMAPQPPIEWKRTAIALSGQQRRRVVGLHFVGMVDAEHHERRAVRRALAVFARAGAGGELVGAERVLGPEVARAQPVDAGEQPRHLVGGDRAADPASPCSALFSAVRMSRPIGLSPAIGSSVRSRMMTFFLPASALTMAASGNGRKTFR